MVPTYLHLSPFHSSGWNIRPPTKRNHKEEDYGMGEEIVFSKLAPNVRAAFLIEAESPQATQELLYMYPPMGLSRQHSCQCSLLARCGDHAMAVALIEVVNKRLGVGYIDNCLSVWGQELLIVF